jgi:hypothetical protein
MVEKPGNFNPAQQVDHYLRPGQAAVFLRNTGDSQQGKADNQDNMLDSVVQ